MRTTETTSARSENRSTPHLKWNLRLGRFLGIDVYLHVTFLIALAFLGIAYGLPEKSLTAALGGILFFSTLFLCVLLHEFGHALAARQYGIRTHDITLLPIGGIARLERIPEHPKQELWIALAGPLVNLVIASGLAIAIAVRGDWQNLASVTTTQGGLAERLLITNLFLALFNLLPAFPMDGGRVLRSLLALRMPHVKATHFAARLGQGMALVFAFIGLFGNPMLLFIALFVWMGASNELEMSQTQSALSGITVSQGMVTQFRTLHPQDSLGLAVRHVLAGSQQDFPVVLNQQIVGVLGRKHLLQGLSQFGTDAPVSSSMLTDFPTLQPNDPLEVVARDTSFQEFPMLPVLQNNHLVGLLTMDNVTEFLLIRSALGGSSHAAWPPPPHPSTSATPGSPSTPPPLPQHQGC